jgi:hypothetical protein
MVAQGVTNGANSLLLLLATRPRFTARRSTKDSIRYRMQLVDRIGVVTDLDSRIAARGLSGSTVAMKCGPLAEVAENSFSTSSVRLAVDRGGRQRPGGQLARLTAPRRRSRLALSAYFAFFNTSALLSDSSLRLRRPREKPVTAKSESV